jgi:hypothetical protein
MSVPTKDEPENLGQLVYDWDMRLIINDDEVQTIEQVKQFLEGSRALGVCWSNSLVEAFGL